MKICHVTSVHGTNDVRILKKECCSLAKVDDYDVYLVGQGESFTYEDVKVIGVGSVPSSRIKRMTAFAQKIIDKAIEIDADVYHLHDPELLRFALGLKKRGKRVIFDSHENVLDSIDDKKYIPFIFRKIVKLYYKKLQQKVFKRIDGIVVVTPQMEEEYKKYSNKVTLITNYPLINNNNTTTAGNIIKGRFIFAGGISEQWSHKEIINALEKIDGVEYFLFGSADVEYLNELKNLKGWEKVQYKGKVSYEEVQNELKKAQFVFALLKPSKNTFYMEGTLGNTKLFEAMDNCKPVIASNFELWKTVVEENNCGVCISPDEDSIEHVIRKLLTMDEETYFKMGENGKKAIERKYNWAREEEKLYLFYRNIMS